MIKEEKKLGDSIPKNPTADFSGFKRREIQTYGTPSSAIKALDDKRRIRCDKVKLQAVDIIAERDLKKEGSLYSHMQPVKSPPWNELVGQRIDVLFAMQYEYPEGDDESCDVKEELRWCQGEVLKILSVAKDNKAASFQVEWDAMADMIGEFTKKTTSDVELKSAKFTKVSDGGWRYDLGLVVLDVDIVEAKPKMKSEQTGVKQKKEEEGEGEIVSSDIEN